MDRNSKEAALELIKDVEAIGEHEAASKLRVFFENRSTQDSDSGCYYGYHRDLDSSLIWEDTEEGYDYWYDIHCKLCNAKLKKEDSNGR